MRCHTPSESGYSLSYWPFSEENAYYCAFDDHTHTPLERFLERLTYFGPKILEDVKRLKMSCDSLFESSQLSFVDSFHDVSGIHANTSQFTPPKKAGGGGKRGQKGKERGEENKVGLGDFLF